jgi:hypothetical protein
MNSHQESAFYPLGIFLNIVSPPPRIKQDIWVIAIKIGK